MQHIRFSYYSDQIECIECLGCHFFRFSFLMLHSPKLCALSIFLSGENATIENTLYFFSPSFNALTDGISALSSRWLIAASSAIKNRSDEKLHLTNEWWYSSPSIERNPKLWKLSRVNLKLRTHVCSPIALHACRVTRAYRHPAHVVASCRRLERRVWWLVWIFLGGGEIIAAASWSAPILSRSAPSIQFLLCCGPVRLWKLIPYGRKTLLRSRGGCGSVSVKSTLLFRSFRSGALEVSTREWVNLRDTDIPCAGGIKG